MTMKDKEFEFIFKVYCSDKAIPLDLKEEEKYRGCRVWTFRRMVKKWRFKKTDTLHKLWKQGKSFSWNNIPEDERESYIDDFYMALTNFDLEFEESAESHLKESTREGAVWRLRHEIDKQYAEQHEVDDIM